MNLIAFAMCLSAAWASIPFVRSGETKANKYVTDAVITGGVAGAGASILAVRRTFSARSALERVIVDLGDKDAKPAGRTMGFFQATLESEGNRLVLDIPQLRSSKVSEPQVAALFRQSPNVASVSFTLDPQDNAGTLVLNLKRPMRLEVFREAERGKPARIVMDLLPAATGKVRR